MACAVEEAIVLAAQRPYVTNLPQSDVPAYSYSGCSEQAGKDEEAAEIIATRPVQVKDRFGAAESGGKAEESRMSTLPSWLKSPRTSG